DPDDADRVVALAGDARFRRRHCRVRNCHRAAAAAAERTLSSARDARAQRVLRDRCLELARTDGWNQWYLPDPAVSGPALFVHDRTRLSMAGARESRRRCRPGVLVAPFAVWSCDD